MRLWIVLILIVTVNQARSQNPSDTILFVYFHKLADTVLVIDCHREPKYKDSYNFYKVYYDSSGAHPYTGRGQNFEKKDRLNVIVDSLSKTSYYLGINLSSKCTQTFAFKGSKKRGKSNWGYSEDYTIKDTWLFENDTIHYYAEKKKYHLPIKKPIEKVLRGFYSAKSFVWRSKDSRLTFFMFITRESTFDEDENEIVTTRWNSNLKKRP